MKIEWVDLQQKPIDRKLVQRVAKRAAADAAATSGTLSIALVDDEHIAALNFRHRRRRRATDVLAYEGDSTEPGYLGDVVISVDTAARQAAEVNRPLDHEVAWLAAHGVLHLLGYRDTTAAERAEMIARQDRALAACLKRRERKGS